MQNDAGIPSIGFSAGHLLGDFSRLASFLDRLTAAEIGHCEIFASELDIIVGGRILRERAEIFRRICSRHSLGYSFHLPLFVNLTDADRSASDVEILAAFVELAGEIGAVPLVLHPGKLALGNDVERQKGILRERAALWQLAEYAQKAGTVISLENPPPSHDYVTGAIDPHGLHPADIADQVKAVGHRNLHFTFDISHAWLSASHLKFDLIAELNSLSIGVGHLHLHDSFGRPPKGPPFRSADEIAFGVGDLHLPIGWGNIPLRQILSAITILPDTKATVELAERFWPEIESCHKSAIGLFA